MQTLVANGKQIIVRREMTSSIKFGLWQASTMSVNGFQDLWVVVRQLVGCNADNGSVLLVSSLNNVGFAELGCVIEAPKRRQPAKERTRVLGQGVKP